MGVCTGSISEAIQMDYFLASKCSKLILPHVASGAISVTDDKTICDFTGLGRPSEAYGLCVH